MTHLNDTTPAILALGAQDAGELLTLQRAAYVTQAQLHRDFDMPPLVQSLDALRSQLGHPKLHAWGIRENGRLVASVQVFAEPPATAELGRLIVAPDRQGQGLGTQLLRHAENTLPAGISAITLFTGELSRDNLRLYLRLGYRETHRTPTGHYELVHLKKLLGDSTAPATDFPDTPTPR